MTNIVSVLNAGTAVFLGATEVAQHAIEQVDLDDAEVLSDVERYRDQLLLYGVGGSGSVTVAGEIVAQTITAPFTLGDGVNGGDVQQDIGASLPYTHDGSGDLLLHFDVPNFSQGSPFPDALGYYKAQVFLKKNGSDLLVIDVENEARGAGGAQSAVSRPFATTILVPNYSGLGTFTVSVDGAAADHTTVLGVGLLRLTTTP